MITEEQGVKTAEKVLKDIKFWGDDVINPKFQLIEGDKLSEYEEAYILISYNYGKDDFGYGNAYVRINLDPITGEVRNGVVTRSGGIPIMYDEQQDKYFKQ